MTAVATIGIVGSVLATGAALAVLIAYTTARLERSLRAWHTEFAADRRALQATMETFRDQMARLAERQSRTE